MGIRLAVLLMLAAVVAPRAGAQDTTRACGPAKVPQELPALDRLFDSAGAIRALSVQDSTAVLQLHVVLTLQFDKFGAMHRLAVLDRDVGVDTALALGRLLASYIRRQEPTELPWGVRVRARLAPEPTVSIERSVFCPPVPDARARARSMATEWVRIEGNAWMPAGTQVLIRLLVDDAGLVLLAEVPESNMSPEVNDIMANNARKTFYKPALLDGFPTTTWLEYNVAIRESRNSRRP